MVLRLRQVEGLELPSLAHPLLDPPFDTLAEPWQAPEPDDLMLGTLRRARQDWPSMEATTSIAKIKKRAMAP